MEKSITANQATIEKLVDTSVSYIKNWSSARVLELVSTIDKGQAPLIVEIGDKGFLIGNYALTREDKFKWRLRYRFSSFEKTFANKKTGLIAAIYYQIGKSNLADKINEDDNLVDRLFGKLKFFEHRMLQAKKNTDYDKMDFYLTRVNEYKLKLDIAKSLLEKKLNLAKYI